MYYTVNNDAKLKIWYGLWLEFLHLRPFWAPQFMACLHCTGTNMSHFLQAAIPDILLHDYFGINIYPPMRQITFWDLLVRQNIYLHLVFGGWVWVVTMIFQGYSWNLQTTTFKISRKCCQFTKLLGLLQHMGIIYKVYYLTVPKQFVLQSTLVPGTGGAKTDDYSGLNILTLATNPIRIWWLVIVAKTLRHSYSLPDNK